MIKNLVLVPYIKKSGKHYKVDMYCKTFSSYITRDEIKSHLRSGYTLKIVLKESYPKGKISWKITEERMLIRLLESFEDGTANDTKLLNRIIRGGGFTSYIRKLEGVTL